MSARLDAMARRLGSDPFFLAAALECFAQSAKCDDAVIAGRLKCSEETLTHLRLCRMPRSRPPYFMQDIEAIATRFGVDAEELAAVVRRGQTVLRLRSSDATPRSGLMAARDREPDPPDEAEKGGSA